MPPVAPVTTAVRPRSQLLRGLVACVLRCSPLGELRSAQRRRGEPRGCQGERQERRRQLGGERESVEAVRGEAGCVKRVQQRVPEDL